VVAQCVVVTEAIVEARPSSPTSSKGQDLLLSSSPLGKEDLFSSSPTPPPNSLVSPYSTHNPLLEDLHSISLSGEDEWGDGKRRGSSGENSTSWVQFGCEEEELIQKATSDRSQQPSHALLSLLSPLSHSPLSPGLQDFSSSPTSGWDSPLGTTPVKGTRLTMSRLASPVGSFSTPVGSPSSSTGGFVGSPSSNVGFPFISQSPPSPTLLDWNKAQVTSPPRGFSTLPQPSPRAVPPLSWPSS